jgi:hypothetical protein
MLVKSSIDSSYNNNLFPNQNYMEQLHDRNIYLLGNCRSLEDHNTVLLFTSKTCPCVAPGLQLAE